MRKTLEIQAFLEYSMVVIKFEHFQMSVPCAINLQYSKIVPHFYCRRFDAMDSFFHPNFGTSRCACLRVLIAILWLCGLLFGAFVPFCCFQQSAALVCTVIAGDELSLWGLFLARLLPVLLTIGAAYFSKPILITLVVFVKAFLFAFTSMSISCLAGSSAPLVCFLLLFSEVVTLPILWMMWNDFLLGNHHFLIRRGFCAVLIVSITSFVDYLYVEPFLRRLIIF